MSKSGDLKPEQANVLKKMTKVRAQDIAFNESGMEEYEYLYNARRLKLEDDENFKKISGASKLNLATLQKMEEGTGFFKNIDPAWSQLEVKEPEQLEERKV